MRPMKTPTSSLSGSHRTYLFLLHLTMMTVVVIELLAMRVRHRTRVWIQRMRSGDTPHETSTTRPSPITRLPPELVEMVIAHLFYDTRSLLTCCLTCYSWYLAAVPHLHHTLITPPYFVGLTGQPWWPDSFRTMHKLGLLPLVRKLQIQGWKKVPNFVKPPSFSPKLFDPHILHQFSALNNVRELGIDNLDIPSFMPNIRHHFGHFLPTVRSLALREPLKVHAVRSSSLSDHSNTWKISHSYTMHSYSKKEPLGDLTLVPPFTPPLRGRLTTQFRGGRHFERYD
jgi:hypothetical protein